MRGKCYIFSAPSGSGKSTIIGKLMQHPELNLCFSISATSRAPRGTEQNGKEYFFLTPQEFRDRIAQGAFLEYEEVYPDHFYGTLLEQVENLLDQGRNVMFDVDVKGGLNIKKHYADQAVSFFIQAPSMEILEQRLRARATDSEEMILKRLGKAEYEMTFAPQFDHIIVNDNLDSAVQQVYNIIS